MPDSTPPASLPPSNEAADATADWLLEALPGGVLVLDAGGRVRRLNRRAAAWWGQLAEAVPGQTLGQLGASQLPAAAFATLQQVAAGQPDPTPHWLPAAGQWLTFSGAAQPTGEVVVYWHEAADPAAPPGQTPADYRALLSALDEGYCRIELLTDAQGVVVDYRFLEVNAVFERQTGLADVVGRRGSELAPGTERHWLDACEQVTRTGEPVHFEQYHQPTGRWYATYASRVGGAGSRQVWAVFSDITARRLADARQAFRLALSEALADTRRPDEVQEAVTRTTMHYLEADRCYYCEITESEAIIQRDAARAGLPSVVGTYPLGQFAILKAVIDQGQPFVVSDVRTTDTVDEDLRQLCLALQVIAYANVPVSRGGRVVGVLCLVQSQPRAWTTDEVELVAETAERTWAAVERARAEEAMRQSEEKYRTLFESIDEGVTTVELLFDETGRAVDFRYLDHNPALTRQTGLTSDIIGQRVSDIAPPLEPHWYEAYERVVKTGEPARFESYFAALNSWFEVHASQVGEAGSRTLVVYNNITERRQQEQRQAFLLHLSDTLRAETGVAAVGNRATQLLAGQLGADRVYLVVLTPGDDHVVVTHETRHPDLPPLLGSYRASDFPSAIQEIFERTIVYDDVRTDARLTELDRVSLAGLGAVGFMAAPIRRGREAMIWAAGALTTQPRAWTAADIALFEDAVERTWAAVERARTEESLRVSEEKFRTLFNSIDEGFSIIELILDEQGRVVDYWHREHNPAFTRLTGIRQAIGRRMSELVPDLEPQWHRMLEQIYRTGEPIRIEYPVQQLGQWYSTYMSRVGGAGSRLVACVYDDITGRKRREANLAFLAEVSEDLAQLTDIDETMSKLGARLGAYLGLSACAFAELVDAAQTGIIRHDWHRVDMPSLLGTYRMADFVAPEVLRRCQAGEAVVIRDVWADPLVEGASYAALHVGSFVSMPLVRAGEWRFLLVVYRHDPHDWTKDEVDLIHEVTARIWARLERARAEQALAASEEKYRTLFQSMNEGFCLLELLPDEQGAAADYRFLEVNPTFERQTGLTDVLGRRGSELMPGTEPYWLATYGQVARTGEPVRFEHYHAGTGRWYDASASRVNGEGSRRVAVVFNDITTRKQVEEALRESEGQLRALIANLPGAAAFVVGPDLRYQLAGGEALDAAGFAPADLLGRTVADTMPPELVPQYEAHYRQALAGQGFAVEHAAHGRTFLSRGVPLPGPTGQPAAVLVVSFDITARKQAEEALRESEQQLAGFNQRLEQQVAARTRELQASRDLLQSVFDTSLVAMSVMEAVRDEAGRVVDFRLVAVNRELEHQTGRRDLVGRLYRQEYPGITEVGIYDLLLQAVATGEPQGKEYYYGHEGFHHWFACQFVQLGDGVVATNLDITERKQAEQQLLANLGLLEQAEQVAGLGSWVAELATGELRWSAGMYRLFGLAPGTPVQPGIYLAYVLPADCPAAGRVVQALTTAPADLEETLRLQVGEETRTLHIKGVVRRDDTGQPVQLLGVDLDISQVQRLEADNLRLHLSQQQALFEAVQAAQEEERRRMAETLHNGIGQLLYATKLQLDHLPDAPAASPRREAARLLSDAIRQTRALSHELTPALLEEFGLAAALQRICRTLSTPTLRWHCHLVLDEGPALPMLLQLAVYRLAQELAQNVVKHARATEATLEVEVLPAWAVLRVEDDGQGFDPARTSDGLGLRTLRSRVALLGGSVHLTTAPGQGTQCQVRLPLTFHSSPTTPP